MNAEELLKAGLRTLGAVGPVTSALPQNMELTFLVESGDFTKNPDTGNYERTATESALVASAVLDTGARPKFYEEVGTDIHQIYYKCRCIEPRTLPEGFNEQTMARCVLTDQATGRETTGQFFVTNCVQNRFKEVSDIIGDSFFGYFVRGGGDVS